MSVGTRAPLVTFVVPVLNDADRLARCLDSIAANGPDGIEVIVVDNGSTDGSDRVAEAKGATLIRKPHAPVSALRNSGAGIAHGDILAFVDADHRIARDWAAGARSALENPRTAAAGAPYTSDGRTWVQRTYDGLRNRSPVRRPVPWLGSGNLAVRRSIFLDLGGFNESLRTCEDVDLSRRLANAGWDIVEDPRLASVHAGDPASLREVWLGEIWRGHDNLAVSFRRPLHWPTVVSALVPMVALAAMVGVLVAMATRRIPLAATFAIGLLALVALRAARICANRRSWAPLAILQSLLVATSYEKGRALGLVFRLAHRNSRRSTARPPDAP